MFCIFKKKLFFPSPLPARFFSFFIAYPDESGREEDEGEYEQQCYFSRRGAIFEGEAESNNRDDVYGDDEPTLPLHGSPSPSEWFSLEPVSVWIVSDVFAIFLYHK